MDDFDLIDFGTDAEDDDNNPEWPATARISGRLARLDPIEGRPTEAIIWLVAEDFVETDDGDMQPAGHQALKIRARISRLWSLTDGCRLTALCRFHRGRLVLERFESIAECDDPMPEARLPKREAGSLNPADGHLADMAELDKAAKAGGYGKLAHSIYRFQVPVHLVFALKYRSLALAGQEAIAQSILRTAAEGEGLEVVAVAVEQHTGGHVHMVLRHAGPGGTPPTFVWSKAIGRIKALASKRIALLPGLEAFPGFRVGYSLTAIHGGRQGADEALSIVAGYVTSQGVQDHDNEDQSDET